MKCAACGYVYFETVYGDENDKEFLEIQNNFFIDSSVGYEPVRLAACPMCYTVRIICW